MPKVSVIIPVYNSEKYLKENLKLLLNQSLQDIEIICVNDGSKDNSINILKELASEDSRIVIIDKENTGAGDSRNKGIDAAKGEYLKFLDADDYMPSNALEILYNKAFENDVDILFFQKENISQNGSLITKFPVLDKVFNLNDYPQLAFKYKASIHNKLYKTSFIKEHQIYFDNCRTCNDHFFAFYSTFLAQKCLSINDVLYVYCGNAKENISSSRGKHAFCLVQTMEHLKAKLEERGIFNLFKKQFLENFRSYLKYEMGFCSFTCRIKFIVDVLKSNCTLKMAVLKNLMLQFFVLSILNFIFSITNKDNEYKVITIFGIKFKLNRRKNAKN